jgi:hypothetical protein|tara:strand:- start:608 stop:802 length:195 start_codon:yes stop_codon:yes gene_type:complete
MKDKINPKYYRRGIEVADFIEEYDLNYFEGNVVKYVVRHKDKNGLEDLQKAKWYLERLIKKYGH